MIDLRQWRARPSPDSFPLTAVVAEFRKVGKHFVPSEQLAALAQVRATLPHGDHWLRRFLDTALDKYDNRFDNPSYLALHDLPLPADPVHAQGERDRLIMLLVADLLRFEIAAHDGTTDLLPLMRPEPRITAKRCNLGLMPLRTAMARMGLEPAIETGDPIDAARIACARVEADMTADERRMLMVTLLTVYTAHDENLFVRVLQCYETTFALAVVQLRLAIAAAAAGDAMSVLRALRVAEQAMQEAAPLFSLVATMHPEAFMAFREFTDGASAIQSRNYKTLESLCRRPDPARLAGPGYDAVPEVRARILAGEATLDDAIAAANLCASERARVQAAMAAFEASVMSWRKAHHNLALRMLGMRRGTGYTAGVPYLAEAKSIPLFSCPFAARQAA